MLHAQPLSPDSLPFFRNSDCATGMGYGSARAYKFLKKADREREREKKTKGSKESYSGRVEWVWTLTSK